MYAVQVMLGNFYAGKFSRVFKPEMIPAIVCVYVWCDRSSTALVP